MTTMTLTRAARAAVSSSVETITPKRAAAYLASMERNRTTRKSKIDQYARDMESGRWHLNGEPVIISSEEKMLDGWHRMKAIIQANVAVPMVVTRGVDPEGFSTIDTGANRSFADVLTLDGEANARLAAGAARLWLLYEQDAITGKRIVPTSGERLAVFQRHQEAIEKGVPMVWKFPTARKLIGVANLAFFASYLCEKVDPETPLLFLESVDKGDALKEGDAVYALRRALVNNAMSPRSMRSEALLAIVIKAFNFWQKNKKVQVLVWRDGEQFPRIEVR